jgi:hypothetical protein
MVTRTRTQMHFVTLHEFRSEELIQITRAITINGSVC